MGLVSFFASSRWDKWFTIPVAGCRLLRGAISTVPTTIWALQPINNARQVITFFRDLCRLINRGNSALAASVDRFVTHFGFRVPVSKSPADW